MFLYILGQKQRVSLARACYCDADIYLLDDPLAAGMSSDDLLHCILQLLLLLILLTVDSHVGNHIFENIIHSETGILRNKTRILVTNNLAVLPYTDTIIVLNNGEISEYGTYEELMKQKNHFYDLIHQYSLNESNNSEENGINDNKKESKEGEGKNNELNFKENKLVEKEETQVGNVKMSVYYKYMKAISTFWLVLFVGNYMLTQACSAGSSVWLSEWSKQNSKQINATDSNSTTIYKPSSSDTFHYLWIYGTLWILFY